MNLTFTDVKNRWLITLLKLSSAVVAVHLLPIIIPDDHDATTITIVLAGATVRDRSVLTKKASCILVQVRKTHHSFLYTR